MKKPKINLSKESLSSFFLHHIEKIILGAALLSMAFFLYNGWSTEKYSKSSPKKLSDDAARAQAHITNTSAWENIEKFRAVDLDAHKRIEQSNERKLNPDDYNVGVITGSPVASMSKRSDPELVSPEKLVARSIRAPILVASAQQGNQRRLSDIDRLLTVRKGARAAAAATINTDDFDEDEDEYNERRSPRRRTPKKQPSEEFVDDVPFGEYVPEVMKLEIAGLRAGGGRFGGGGAAGEPLVLDFVAVTGVVPFNKQFNKYEAAFRNAVAYYPRRDRPQYLYMEVQRRVGGGEWEDISEFLSMAERRYGAESPEVIASDYFHPVTVRPIPPLANTDTRNLARHPDVPLRKMVPDSFATRNEAVKGLDIGAFNTGDVEIDGMGPGDRMDTMDDGEVGMMGMDKTPFEMIDLLRAPKVDTKMVRFFDLRATKGSVYQYRVRLWLNDPNDPAGFGGEGAGNALQMGRAFDENDMAEDGMGGMGIQRLGGKDDEEELEDLDRYPLRAISGSMQDREVRNRLRAKSEAMDLPVFNFPNNSSNARIRQEQLNQLLSTAWHTPWSEPTEPVTCGGGGTSTSFYAGAIEQPSTLRCGDVELPRGERTGNLVTSELSGRFNVAVSGQRKVGRGDVLNYTIPISHLVHPKDGSVRLLENQPVRTGAVVVDLMGGELVDGEFKLPVNMPGEILVLQSDFTLKLQNNFDDLRGYRHSLLLEDEEGAYGESNEDNPRGRDSEYDEYDNFDDEYDG